MGATIRFVQLSAEYVERKFLKYFAKVEEKKKIFNFYNIFFFRLKGPRAQLCERRPLVRACGPWFHHSYADAFMSIGLAPLDVKGASRITDFLLLLPLRLRSSSVKNQDSKYFESFAG